MQEREIIELKGTQADGSGESLAQIGPISDPIESSLANALATASAAGEWSTVARLASELEARRLARSAVVDLNVERKRRGQS